MKTGARSPHTRSRGKAVGACTYREAVIGRRLVVAALVGAMTVPASLVVASPALAWSNGVHGPNTYGTHDWILDHALDGLGERAG